MLITIKKEVEVEETIEVKTPCWLASPYGFYAHITEGGDLIEVFANTVCLREASDPVTPIHITNLLGIYHSCTEQEFKEQLDKRLYKLQETYTA